MFVSPYLSLILPAYNEAARIGQTIDSMRSYLEQRRYSFEIIVSADGEDGTREVVAKLGAEDARISVIGNRVRAGKGLGIRHGVARATGRIVGFADADNKVPISEMDKLLPWFSQGYDIVMGSRAVADARLEVLPPLHRRLGSRGFAIIMHALIGLWDIHDTQCGFKFFLQPVARDLFSRQRVDGYMFDVEILHLAKRWGYRIKEVGVRWRDDGDTRLKLVAGNWRNMLDLLRIRFAHYDNPTVRWSYPQTVDEIRKAG
jgi:dolichyl-phosphate beta-glucosyltransferase